MKIVHGVVLAALLVFETQTSTADEVGDAIDTIAKVGPEAIGSQEAKQARRWLAQQGSEILPRLLAAMDTSNIVAANWYRTAFDVIAERELARPRPGFPRQAIEEYVRDSRRSGRARRLGFALLERLEPMTRDRLLPEWLDDVEFRRDSVEYVLRLGDRALEEKQIDRARHWYEQGFRHARDSEQVLLAVAKLKAVGQDADPVAHLGFITRWWLVGPFPAAGMSGFAAEFPPEKEVNLAAQYDGPGGQKIPWKLHQTADRLAEVNLIQALGTVKEAVAYAYAELDFPRQQELQLRCSADDNLTVWLNGHKVLAREQWLNGTRLDRFVTSVTLNEGTNRILVKVCQGPQHVNPEVPNNWSFQLRLCNETGEGVSVRNLLPTPK